MRWTSSTLLSSTLMLSLIMAGCGNSTSATHPTGSAKLTSTKGGTAVIALTTQQSPTWFFPLRSQVTDTVTNEELELMMYKPLITVNGHDQLDYARSLARSITTNAAGDIYTIHLNPKWHWSNGQPVTAQDVVFTWQIMKAASQSSAPWTFWGEGFGGFPTLWQSVTAKGPYTVIVKISSPRNPAWFIRNGLGQIIPAPKSVWDRYPHNMNKELQYIQSIANSPTNAAFDVVDGPYHFSRYAPNNYWSFVPNLHYDGHQSSLSKVIYQYESSASNEFTALKTGTLNAGSLPPSLLSAKSQLTGDTVIPEYVIGFNYIVPNQNPHAPGGIGQAFQSLAVRQALQMGIDQPAIIKDFYHGYAVMDDTTLAPLPKTPFFDPALNTNPYPFNPQKGKTLLEQHGWHEQNGVMTKNGIKLQFTLIYASGSTAGTDLAELLKNDWAQEGIKVNLVSEPFNEVVSHGASNASSWAMIDWDQSVGGWTYGTGYPSGGGLFSSTGSENMGSYSSLQMNQLIQGTYEPGTTAQTLQRMYSYENFAAHQLPVLFIPDPAQIIVHSKNLHGVAKSFDPAGAVFLPNHWWFSSH
ncbi:peptide/nickel transport system substrate-binding protein [Sulfobacillus thermosulfidooxidans DSM 9293]|uniref:Peptide/nickel transport system substrate-binding protein n=1 Tax=Sulfobacillus thermosulfidooxidans (strain DSM 9293 / VKM B-1269 / AT-1) TaxID=929705 RepID=A0A1W1WFA8_SULTA|nr:peptide ABC transporter substrate-binding protein [Sulfobacillus thermosulfidooxidans]SMC04991.1 peptide/nickel transport system substrate-binding protein [Sulfobacillus thermosulfidooxidans DSM 9293]